MPRVIVTDKLRSYGAARDDILPGEEQRQHRYLNNRAEVSRARRHDNSSGRCAALSHRAKPNISFLLTAPSPIYKELNDR